MLSKNFSLLILLLTLSVNIFSQTTNTKKWRKTEKDTMASAVLMYDDANYLLALPLFENLYSAHPKEEFLNYCYGKCALYRSDKHEIALKLLGEVYEKNKKVENIEYDFAKANHFNYKFDEALVLLDKYLSKKGLSPEFKNNANQ
jgi:predicted Zn-dependent protease